MLLVIVPLLAGTMMAGCAAEEEAPKTLRVGCIMPFSGPAAAWGVAIRPQMDIYAELINEDGGIKIGDDTYMVEMFYADGEYMPEPGAKAAQKLVTRDKVQFIVGYYGMGAVAVDAVTSPAKVILMGKGYPEWDAEEHPYTVWGTPSYDFLKFQALACINAYPETKKLCLLIQAIAMDPELMEDVEKTLAEIGVEFLSVEYPAGEMDFTTYLAKLDAEGVDLLLSGGSTGENAMMVKQSYEGGYTWVYAQMGTMLDPYEFIEACGYEAAQGVLSDSPAPWRLKENKPTPELLDMAHRISERYEEKYDTPMRYMGAFGYGLQHMSLLFDALKQAGTIDTDKVMEVLWGGTFETFLGRYTMTGWEKYNGPICSGYPCAFSKIEGYEEVYAGEYACIVK